MATKLSLQKNSEFLNGTHKLQDISAPEFFSDQIHNNELEAFGELISFLATNKPACNIQKINSSNPLKDQTKAFNQ